MPKKEPLYPHVPKSRQNVLKPALDGLRFLPDSPEFLAETIICTGCRDKLDNVFQAAIARVRGK